MNVAEELKDLVEQYEDIFREELPKALPPKRDLDFEIKLKSDALPPVRPVIRLSTKELAELRMQLTEMVDKGFLRPPMSPYDAPVIFVKKKSGELRMVCDYRALNKITIPDSNPLPLISEALHQVSGATVFSKTDLLGAYHQMRIREEDIPKTAIRTRYGPYEWTVLCFGLTNAPASFTRLLTSLLRELNGVCVVIFLDDILVYSCNMEEHKKHLTALFDILQKENLYAKIAKCEIGRSRVEFVGHVVSADGIDMQMDLKKAILDWPVRTTIRQVQQFIGMAKYCRKFIKGYASILRPVSDISRSKKLVWNQEQEEAFENLKRALTEAFVLAHPSSHKTFVVSPDASQFAVGATLEQDGKPVAYLSHRLNETEMRWCCGDQELLAFMIALRDWKVYLKGRRFVFKTDHEPIRYLQSKDKLLGRQARWLDTIQSFTFETEHIPEKKNVVPDALSPRPDHEVSLKFISTRKNFLDKVRGGYKQDKFAAHMIGYVTKTEKCYSPQIQHQAENYEVENDLLLWTANNEKRVFIPEHESLREDMVRGHHEPSHLGAAKTYGSLARQVFWKGMYEDVISFCAKCHGCQINKKPNKQPGGALQPHDIPKAGLDTITIDFLTELPLDEKGVDAIFIVVDKLSKRAVFIPTKKTLNAIEAAELLQRFVFSVHGVPRKFISDRDPKFNSTFWKGLTKLLDIELNMSTADHPQTDGQSEITIRTLSGMLRHSIQKSHDSWSKMFPILEFEYNAA